MTFARSSVVLLVLTTLLASPSSAETWATLVEPGAAVHGISFDPTNPDRIFVGTWGRGMYRSADGGKTWSGDSASFTTPSGNSITYVFDAAFDPSDPTRGVAVTRNGTFTTTTGGVRWRLHPANATDSCPELGYEVRPLPDGSGAVISELGTGSIGGRMWVYRWDSNDFWIGTAADRLGFLGNESVLGMGFGANGVLYVGHTRTVYWSDDLGHTLVRNDAGLPDNEARAMVPDPEIPGRVLCAVDGGLYRQTSLGSPWRRVGEGLPAPVRSLVHHPLDADVVFAATNLGVYRSDDRGDTWSRMGINGMDYTIVADVAIHPRNPNFLYASANDLLRRNGAVYATWVDVVTSVEPSPPDAVELLPAPNPTGGRTAISFRLARPARVRLDVFDLAGRRADTVVDGELGAGRHRVAWDGRDASGRPLGSGVYFLRLELDGRVAGSQRLVLRR